MRWKKLFILLCCCIFLSGCGEESSNISSISSESVSSTSGSDLERPKDDIIYEDADYQDLGDHQQENDGRYVRIAGQISSIERDRLFFPDKIFTSDDRLVVHFEDFVQGDIGQLKAGDCVVICGVLRANKISDQGNPRLTECYLELYGEEAEKLVNLDKINWNEKREIIKQDYINNAKKYTYAEIVRNPEEYQTEIAQFTGTVIQADDFSFLLLVNGSPDQVIFVYYNSRETGTLKDNDYVTVYGELDGLQEYTTAVGTLNTEPLLRASYILLTKR